MGGPVQQVVQVRLISRWRYKLRLQMVLGKRMDCLRHRAFIFEVNQARQAGSVQDRRVLRLWVLRPYQPKNRRLLLRRYLLDSIHLDQRLLH